MEEVFLGWLKKKNIGIFGLVLTSVTTMAVVIAMIEYTNILRRNWFLYSLFTLVIFYTLFMFYVESVKYAKS